MRNRLIFVFKRHLYKAFICLFIFTYGILIGKYEFPPYRIIQAVYYKLNSLYFNNHNYEHKNSGFIISKINTNKCNNLKTNEDSIILRIIVAGDGHFGENYVPWENQYATTWEIRYEKIIYWLNNEIESNGVDFIVFNGDNVHDDNTLLSEVKVFFDRIKTNYYVVHGNHDFSTDEQWERIWGYSWNYVFEKENYAFVLLNSSYAPNSYNCGNNVWLRKVLHEHEDKDGVFVFCHIPQHPWISQNDTIKELLCPKLTSTLLSCENLKMVIYSHCHDCDGHNKMTYKNSEIDFFFTGHFGHWGLPYYGYRVIEIYDDGSIKTFQYNPLTSKTMNCSFL